MQAAEKKAGDGHARKEAEVLFSALLPFTSVGTFQ